jgi:hypothetical protein
MPETDLPERDWRLAKRVREVEEEVQILKREDHSLIQLNLQYTRGMRMNVLEWRRLADMIKKQDRRLDRLEEMMSTLLDIEPVDDVDDPDAEEISKGQTFIAGYDDTV